MTSLRLVGTLDPNFGWAGAGLLTGKGEDPPVPIPPKLRGAYASVYGSGETVARLVRDPLGINKLFWGLSDDGTVLVAARPHRLVQEGCPFETIRAIPAGAVIELDFQRGSERVEALPPPPWAGLPAEAPGIVEGLAEHIYTTLDSYCEALAEAYPGAPVFVCLSGGLDSSGVAVLARTHFTNVTAVSFDVDRHGPPSADRRAAERVARDLGLPLLTVTVSEDDVLEGLDTAITEGIDWRDFNVHAALVNVALAQGIARSQASAAGPGAPLVLTGDLMNEYINDYHPEQYRGHTYYALPQLRPAALQRALVRGLETSHREIGPFQASGLAVVQVCAPVVDHYLALPETFLADPARKNRLSRLVFGGGIPDYVYARPKTRAQVGDEETGRGVLGVCIDHGIDEAWLRQRFAELHQVCDPTALDRFIRAGRYHSSVPKAGAQP